MCNSLQNIACCITLYLPDKYALNNAIKDNGLYKIIIDNTNNDDIDYEVKSDKNCRYIRLGTNHGVAFALNMAAHTAIKSGYEWLLTLDQDSKLSMDMVENILACVKQYKFEKIGIITAIQVSKEADKRLQGGENEEVLIAMTSGSLLNLKAYQECGFFCNKLFIDHVDNEYCLRLKRNGFKIIRCNKAILKHSVGRVREISLLGYKIVITTHNPFRLYFFIRNGLYVSFKYLFDYPFFSILFCIHLGKIIAKAIFLEDNKIERIGMVYAGLIDFLLNRFGRRFI